MNLEQKNITQFEKDMLELLEKSKYNIAYNKNTRSLYSRTKINDFVDTYVVFDLETTGYSPKDNEIIEISAVKYDNNQITDTFNYLVKPSNSLSSNITHLTGITENMLKVAPNLKDIFPLFLDFINGYTLVAYNGSFDLAFVEHCINNFNYKMIDNPNIDVLYLAKNYICGTSNYKLETLKKYFNLDYPSHRALYDCYTTNYIYQYCKNNLPISVDSKNLKQNRNTDYKKYIAFSNEHNIKKYKDLFTNNKFLNNKNITITGEMEHFNRNELLELLNMSNVCILNSVTKKTNLLIVGYYDSITSKQKRAYELISQGQNIDIIDESTLLNKLREGVLKC